MKKTTLLMLLMVIFSSCLISCSSDDDGFDYPMEQLYGKWRVTMIKVDGSWYDVTKYPYTKFGMDITFYDDGTYYGSGYLGNGSGTYKVSGKTITTYVSGKVYVTYTINSLSENVSFLTLTMGDQSLEVKAEKEY